MSSPNDYSDDVFANLDPDLFSSPSHFPYSHPLSTSIFDSPSINHQLHQYPRSVPITSLFSTELFTSLNNSQSPMFSADPIVHDRSFDTNGEPFVNDTSSRANGSFPHTPGPLSSAVFQQHAPFDVSDVNGLETLSQGLSNVPFTLEPAPLITPPPKSVRSTQLPSSSNEGANSDMVPSLSQLPLDFDDDEPPAKRQRPNPIVVRRSGHTHAADEGIMVATDAVPLEIVNSPQKGRRLQLPRTPVSSSAPLPPVQPATPTRSGGLRPAHELQQYQRLREESPCEDARERLARRIRAFTEPRTDRPMVQPVILAGKGRVLMRCIAGKPLDGFPSPLKPRRPNVRKGRKSNKPPSLYETLSAMSAAEAEEVHRILREEISSVDQEFPWNDKLQREAKRQREILILALSDFLSDGSDAEDEEELSFDPFNKGSPSKYRMGRHIGSVNRVVESADAREAFMAHRTVQLLLSQLKDTMAADGDEDNTLHCICRGPDDGRDMVRCDQCDNWFHQDCMGIQNPGDLGDTWFCEACIEAEELEKARQPVLVPTIEEPPFRATSHQLPLYQVQNSPNSAAVSTGLPPRTPRRRVGNTELQTPNQGNHRARPASPSKRKWGKAKVLFEDYSVAAPDSPFDPTSTPSRGIKLGVLAGMNTPKGWNPRNTVFATPIASGSGTSHEEPTEPTDVAPEGNPQYMPAGSSLAPVALEEGGPRRGRSIIHEFGGELQLNNQFGPELQLKDTTGDGPAKMDDVLDLPNPEVCDP